jgi:hypothetical protein
MSGFRVNLDLDRIAATLCTTEERPVRESEVRLMLRKLGFIAIEQGQAWLATSDCLAVLSTRLGSLPFKAAIESPHPELAPTSQDQLAAVTASWGKLSASQRNDILRIIRSV